MLDEPVDLGLFSRSVHVLSGNCCASRSPWRETNRRHGDLFLTLPSTLQRRPFVL